MNEHARDGEAAEEHVRVRIGLGCRLADMADLAQMDRGRVVELDTAETDDVDVYVGGRLHARGQAVVVDGDLAVRVSEIVDAAAPPDEVQDPAAGEGAIAV